MYLTQVPMDKLRCQRRPFSELQGFSGKTIDHFPPCRFFEMYLTAPDQSYNAFCNWLRECLLDLQAWKVPRSEGGWANGSLVKLIAQVHQEHGLTLIDFERTDPALIDEAISRKAKDYLALFNSIQEKGYIKSLYPPIFCQPEDGVYFISGGHHRVSALWVLGYRSVDVVIQSRLPIRA
jgi:hypothetical protein